VWLSFATSLVLSARHTVTTPECPPVATSYSSSGLEHLLNLLFISITEKDLMLSMLIWPELGSNFQILAILSLELVTRWHPS